MTEPSVRPHLNKAQERTRASSTVSSTAIEFPRQELGMTCNIFGIGEEQEQIWTVKVMEIRPGGSKLGPQALRGNLNRGQTYYNTGRFPFPLLLPHQG